MKGRVDVCETMIGDAGVLVVGRWHSVLDVLGERGRGCWSPYMYGGVYGDVCECRTGERLWSDAVVGVILILIQSWYGRIYRTPGLQIHGDEIEGFDG